MARDEGLESVIVCEDDLNFSRDFNSRVHSMLADLASNDWGLCYAGHLDLALNLADAISPVPPFRGIMGMHFMIMRRCFFLPFIPYLEAILARPPGHPDGGPMHIDGALSHFRADHPEFKTVAVTPVLGYQRPSRTDIHALRWYDRVPFIRYAAELARRSRSSRRVQRRDMV